jgi:hypothetical protein
MLLAMTLGKLTPKDSFYMEYVTDPVNSQPEKINQAMQTLPSGPTPLQARSLEEMMQRFGVTQGASAGMSNGGQPDFSSLLGNM